MSRWCQSPATVGWVLHGEAERRDGAPVRGRVAAAGGGRGALVAGPTGGPGGPLVGARAVDGEGAPARPRRRPGRAAAGRGAGGRAGRRARRRVRAGPGDPPARGAVARRAGRRARGAGRGGVRGDRRAGAGHPPAAVPGRCRARQGQGAEAARRPAGVGVVDGPLGGAGRRPVRSRGRPLRGPRRDPAGRLIHRGLTSSPRNPVLRRPTLEPPGPPVLRGATLEPPGPPVLRGATLEPPGPPLLRGAALAPPGPPVLPGATLEPPGPPVLRGADLRHRGRRRPGRDERHHERDRGDHRKGPGNVPRWIVPGWCHTTVVDRRGPRLDGPDGLS